MLRQWWAKPGGGAGAAPVLPPVHAPAAPGPRFILGPGTEGGSRDLQGSVHLSLLPKSSLFRVNTAALPGQRAGPFLPCPHAMGGEESRWWSRAPQAGQESRWAVSGWGCPGLGASGAPATPFPCWKSASHFPEAERLA